MNKLDPSSKFGKVLKKFVERHKHNPNVIGILVSGSCIHSKPDKNSDLDVQIILNKSKTRERGNTWIDGVEIEYFINPVNQIKNYFKIEVGEKVPSTSHMLSNSIVIYKKGKQLDQLIRTAKRLSQAKAPKMSTFEVESAKYLIDDMVKDLEDVLIRKDPFAFHLIAHDILSKCLQIFLRVQRVRKEKNKRLKNYLAKLDNQFDSLFSNVLLEVNMLKKYKKALKLVAYVEKLIGGKRPKEWKLKSRCVM